MKLSFSLLLLISINLFSASNLEKVYLSGQCIGPKDSSVEYQEGDEQYCGYVIVNGVKKNILGRAHDCTRLTYERVRNGCANSFYRELDKVVVLHPSIADICYKSESKGIVVDLKAYKAKLGERCY